VPREQRRQRGCRIRAGFVTLSLAGACSALSDFPEPVSEEGFERCSDGIDNDLDGFVDCPDDADCACNPCGEAFVEQVDTLGRFCARDCECPVGQICNPRVDRCLPTRKDLEDDSFFAAFRVPIVDNRFPRENESGNFGGAIRIDGERVELTRMLLEDNQLSFETTSEVGTRSALILQTVVPFGAPLETKVVFGPLEDVEQVFFFDDQLSVDDVDSEPEAFRADYAYVVSDVDDEPAVNQQLTLESGDLRFAPLETLPEGLWAGSLEGKMRPSTAFDRARSASCDQDEVYEPTRDRCVAASTAGDLFFLGCAFDPSGSPFAGEVVYRWVPFWQSNLQRDNTTACVAVERTDGSIAVRALGGTTTGIWILALEIPEFRALDLRSFSTEDLDDEEDATLHRLVPVPEGRSALPSLFELDLSDDDAVLERGILRGRITIDLISRGATPRLLAWVRAEAFEPF